MAQKKCDKCGQSLKVIRWNSGIRMAFCDNGRCVAYRRPISNNDELSMPVGRRTSNSFKEVDRSWRPELDSRLN
jgi:hypothetical protein